MKKALALVLSLLMIVTVLPFASFAEEPTEAERRVDAWDANYDLFIDKLTDNADYANFKYVVDNDKEIANLMGVYTAFGMYDSAWVNAATGTVDKAICKEVLVAMLEKYSYDMGTSYVDIAIDALKAAQTVGEFMEKLNEYFKIFDFVDSETWSKSFTIVNYVIQAGRAWQDVRSDLIKAYERVMTVQMANKYYIDMLDYVVANSKYAPMVNAANELINEIKTSVNEQIADMVAEALQGQAAAAADTLITMAMNTNAYTAVALKVYQTGTSIANKLWNTNAQYELYSALKAAFYAETAINEWTQAALAADDADCSLFAVSALISTREFGETTLYKLMVAKSGGIIGKIKSKLYNYCFTEYTANLAALDIMRDAFYATDINEIGKISVVDYIYCPVNVLVYNNGSLLMRVKDGAESETGVTPYGFGASNYSEYNKEYIKVLALANDYDVNLIGTKAGFVTFVKDIVADNEAGFEDYSFTEVACAEGSKIVISGLNYEVTLNGETNTYELNDDFVIPEGKTVTVKDVIDATVDVGKDEAKSLIAKIKAIFQKIIDAIKNLFKIA